MTPNARFVIACPVCRGRVAALVGNAGRTGCCPLCAATLVVPDATAAAVADPEAPFAGLNAASPQRPHAGDGAGARRRLTNERRRNRRMLRNLLLLIVGGALLIALTVAFGHRPGR
jgi:hypothetical protein